MTRLPPTTPMAVSPRRVLIELGQTHEASEILAGPTGHGGVPRELETARELSEAGLTIDADWPAITLGPGRHATTGLARRPRVHRLVHSMYRLGDAVAEALPRSVPTPSTRAAADQRILLRGELPAGDDGRAALEAARARDVRVFADPAVTLCERRSDDPAYGTTDQVAAALAVDALHAAGMTGTSVPVVLVDNGIALERLRALGRAHPLDQALSCTTSSTYVPGSFPVDHGTMAAFQVGIAAPQATLADQAVILGSSAPASGVPMVEALLSDIAPGYELALARLSDQPPGERALVISNSWAVTRPEQDFPLGTPECFSDNRDHPFNDLVRKLVDAGADVVFAAGNCGETDPMACTFRSQPIRGANALDEVLTIGAVDVDGVRLAYSSQGLGLIAAEKPDVCGYSHYRGSQPEKPDLGTSAACPGVAGVVAAVRSVVRSHELPPAALAAAIRATAQQAPSSNGYDPDLGYGVIDPGALLARLRATKLIA